MKGLSAEILEGVGPPTTPYTAYIFQPSSRLIFISNSTTSPKVILSL